MSLEKMICWRCHGTGGKRKVPARPRHTVVCNYGHKHTVPAKKATTVFCKECGGSGIVLEVNFGRQ
jgi:DnaJ-class molecular chaperone